MNLLDYRIIGGQFCITNQWSGISGIGRLGTIDQVVVRSDGYPALYVGDYLCINLRGETSEKDTYKVSFMGYQKQVVPVLEKLAATEVHSIDTESGTAEYIQIPENHTWCSQVIILRTDHPIPPKIAEVLRFNKIWYSPGDKYIKFNGEYLDLVLEILNNKIPEFVETIFFKEQTITL